MIPVEPFVNPVAGSREHNAVKKALKEKPLVIDIGVEPQDFMPYRSCHVGEKQYVVSLYADVDEQHFVECSCAAGTPPVDPDTNLPTREASPCYHAAALLISEKEKDVSTD